MNKQAPSVARILTMVAFALSCFGLLLFLWLAFGGSTPLKPKGYRVTVAVDDATTLGAESDVRTSGVTIGRVVKLDLAPGGRRTLAELEIESRFAPLREDARAILRQKTLLGETYVELTMGNPRAATVPDNGRLADGQVADAVEFDELLTIFDAPTRKAFQDWQATMAQAGAGRADELNSVLGRLPGFVGDGQQVFAELRRRDEGLRSLIRGTGTTFDALNRNGSALTELVQANATVMRTIAGRRESLADTIRILPTFLRETRLVLRRVQATSRGATPLLRDLAPVLRDTGATVRALRTLAPDATTAFRSLPVLAKAADTGMPALSKVLRGFEPTLRATTPFLAEFNPILRFLEYNQVKLTDFVEIGPSALKLKTPVQAGNKSVGHALPQLIMLGSQTLTATDRSADNRGNAYQRPDALVDPRLTDPSRFALPSFDCGQSGEKAPTDTPGCYVQGPNGFEGTMSRYPQVDAGATAP